MNSTQDIPLGPIMTSVSGLELDQENKERLLSPVVGGVVLFADNCDTRQQIQKLTNDIHQLRNPPLMIAIDQEGGRVQRIKCDVTQLPPQARYGEIFDENSDNGCDAAELGGYLMAREMLEMGIDISFSPVLDIATVDSDVIGDRSFHGGPLVVSTLAEAWIRGMQNAGMHSVGKHFPGHGGVSQDSHLEMPEDNRIIQDILASDLLPYRRLGDRLSAVMTAHVLYPEITSAIPTYSSFWLDHVLREVIAFYGVVFSDDLSMRGADHAGDMETRVLTALSSGCDIALICQSASDTDEAIEAMTKNTSGWRDTTWYYDRIRPEVVEFTDRLEDCRERFMNCIEQQLFVYQLDFLFKKHGYPQYLNGISEILTCHPYGNTGSEVYIDGVDYFALTRRFIRPLSGNQILVSPEDPFCGQRIFFNPDNYNNGLSDHWQLQMMRAAQGIPQTKIPRQAKGIVDLYDDSDDQIPIYDKSTLSGFYMAVGNCGNQYKNGSVVGEMTAELTVACENSHDHDQDPVQFKLEHQERSASMGVYFRLREVNADNSFSVLG